MIEVSVIGYKGLKEWLSSSQGWSNDRELGHASLFTPGNIYVYYEPTSYVSIERMKIDLVPSMDEILEIIKIYLPMLEGDIPRLVRRNIDGLWFVVHLMKEVGYTDLMLYKHLVDALYMGQDDEEKGSDEYAPEY